MPLDWSGVQEIVIALVETGWSRARCH